MFHPIIQNWFTEKYGVPTGSSKTLTAFLWYINGQPAAMSPYLSVIENSFNLFRDYKSVIIQREL